MGKLQEKFNDLIAEQEALRKKFQETAQELFKETTNEFFEANPGVNAIVWTQYSPFFNDGDECVFRVNDPSFTNAVEEQLDNINYGEYDGEDENVWVAEAWSLTSTGDWAKELRNKIKECNSVVDVESLGAFSDTITSNAMEDVMESMFGNHVRVVATRDGFYVDDFDHD